MEMQLRAGDSLELESSEDRIVLRPRRGGVGLHKKQGIWVFSTGQPISAEATDETLRQMRRERELGFLSTPPMRAPPTEKDPVKWFFDSSVLVPALLPDHEHHARSFAAFAAASPKTAGCAAHSPAEVYATLTRYPGKERLSAESADLLVEEIEHRLTLVWLDGDEYRAAVRRIARMGIVGGAIYDGLVAECALKAGADRLYTWNVRHFNLLGAEIKKLITMPPVV